MGVCFGIRVLVVLYRASGLEDKCLGLRGSGVRVCGFQCSGFSRSGFGVLVWVLGFR